MEDKQLLLTHDKKIDKLELSIEHLVNSIQTLAASVGTSNRKIEDMTSVINTQNILMERFTNMDKDLKESFGRVYSRVEKLEINKEQYDHIMNVIGCPSLLKQNEAVKSAHKRIDKIDSSITWVVRLVFGLVITALIGLVISVKG
jgi:hypothetical protein